MTALLVVEENRTMEKQPMITEEIKVMQRKISTAADGYWGPKSIAALQTYLRRLMPSPNPWPETNAARLQAYYGDPGDEAQLVNLPVSSLGMLYEGKPVQTVRCHRKVAESLGRVLRAIADSPHAWILKHYDGCYCDRPMRNGTSPSLHARGAAIDLNDAENGNLVHWPAVATMPLEVMEIFAREGWLPAGAFWGRDAAHFQATR
jgi:hypothetical protein